jgi:thiol:disulfide interchange protein DsbD
VLVWATAQPAAMVFLVFNTIGVGMALPYVVLTANPGWLRFVPRPGPWLTTFKQAMAFLLMATVVYLLYIVEGQLGGRALVWTLVFLVGVALACWIVGTWVTIQKPVSTRWVAWGVAVAVVGLSAWIAFGHGVHLSGAPPKELVVSKNAPDSKSDPKELPWVPFSLEKLQELTAQGKPVFLDITARWCPNCQWNSRFVLNTSTVAEAVENHGAVPMLADWTAREELIGNQIEKLAPGASIPLAAMFPAGRPDEPIVMLGILSKQQVIDALRQGGQTTNMASEATPAEGG